MSAEDPRQLNERGEVIGNYLTPDETRAMGLVWKPRPGEPPPYLTQDEVTSGIIAHTGQSTGGRAYVEEAAHYAAVGNYDYGSDAYRLEELRGLLRGQLTVDQVVIPASDTQLFRTLIETTPAASVLHVPAPPATPAAPPPPMDALMPQPPGGTVPVSTPAPPATSTTSPFPLSPVTSALVNSPFAPYVPPRPATTGAGAAPGTLFGFPAPLVLAVGGIGAYLYFTK